MGGAPKIPQPPTPGEAAQAAVGTAGAGEMMSIANQPVEQYANLYTTTQLGPAEMQTQQALANQAAYQAALAQQDIQSRVDPQAYAQRQMRMLSANTRLAKLYGMDPSAFRLRAPGAYQVGDLSQVAPLTELTNAGQTIAGNLSMADVNKAGGDPRLIAGTAQNLNIQTPPRGYFT